MPIRTAAVAAMLALALAGTAWADNDKGKGHGQGHGRGADHGPPAGRQAAAVQGFSAADTRVLQDYFGRQSYGAHCPPGLAKKDNGCMPPGQARAWTEGKALPTGLATYPLPNELLSLVKPPAGYSYVRSGADILMLAQGTNIVVSAIRDLVR